MRQLPGERAAWVATAQRADGHCQKLVCFCVFWDEQENCQPHWGSGDADFFQKRHQTRLFAGIDAPPLEKRETQHETYALLLEQVGDRGAVPQRPHAAAAAESAAAGGGGPRRRRRPVGSYWRCAAERGGHVAACPPHPPCGCASALRAALARADVPRAPGRAGAPPAATPRVPRWPAGAARPRPPSSWHCGARRCRRPTEKLRLTLTVVVTLS